MKIIKTRGDERHRDFGLVDVRAGCEGLFAGEIERALVAKAIDLAAHFGFVNLIARFPYGRHDIDYPLHGNTTVILVPLPRALVIFNSPPICATRSRMPVKPTPSC
jgi:hypothetical protein